MFFAFTFVETDLHILHLSFQSFFLVHIAQINFSSCENASLSSYTSELPNEQMPVEKL